MVDECDCDGRVAFDGGLSKRFVRSFGTTTSLVTVERVLGRLASTLSFVFAVEERVLGLTIDLSVVSSLCSSSLTLCSGKV